MRPLAGRVYIEVIAGSLINDNIFFLELEVVGNDVHLLRPPTTPLVFTGAADGYHSYRFISGYSWNDALVFFDDTYAGTRQYDSFGFGGPSPRMIFGTDHGVAGRARFHYAYFGLVPSSFWGVPYCGPAVPNSTGEAGTLRMYGSILYWQNNMQLLAENLPPNQFGYFLTSQTPGFSPTGQGNLCLGGAIGRFNLPGQVQSTGATGSMSLVLDTGAMPTPAGTMSMSNGQTWSFQAWHRDLNPGPTSNLTEGLRLVLP